MPRRALPTVGKNLRAINMVLVAGLLFSGVALLRFPALAQPKGKPLAINPPLLTADASIKYDYDIVYVRAPRKGDDQQILWA